MTRSDVEIMASIVAIILAWLCFFGLVTGLEWCAGVDERPAVLSARGGR